MLKRETGRRKDSIYSDYHLYLVDLQMNTKSGNRRHIIH